MAKYKIEFDKENCIGAFACTAVAELFWKQSESDPGKADLTGAEYNEKTGKWEIIIDQKDYRINEEAAEVCPVQVIKITKISD